ncbi:NYN domain-containing protein [Clostridium botulinum]|uniref:NYN domain-containing protein n=1 Tax=Clostridium botulinum TaxID=1491 RepID=UPI001C9B677C|nr:NYN domain-containing protein [Clostridium botulinum]MBY6796854.1 NYN domain-containing protein [Clostridium botulinum]MBY6866722.1 NYN domain-containing protein [Clostridium botulinum]
MSNISIYVDYDNIYIMLEKYYQEGQATNLSTDIIKKIREIYKEDKILTFKAFCDFQKATASLTELQKNQVELRHVYSSGDGDGRKNASDIALAIDVVKNLFNKNNCDKYILVSSDSDMLPLINELTYNGKEVEVIYSKYGSKDDYREYLSGWGIKSYTIEELLKIETYEKINEEKIKEDLEQIINIINNGIKYTFNKFSKTTEAGTTKGTCSKKDIQKSLKRASKYKENDISIIIDKLIEWNIIKEVISPYNSKFSIVLINDEYISEKNIKLEKKIITIADFQA